MKCEHALCNTERDISFGSGRFCSLKCARSFSTFKKKELITRKIGEKLIKDGNKTLFALFITEEISKKDFCLALNESKSYGQLLTKLGAKICGSSSSTAKKFIGRWDLSTSHFDLKNKPIDYWLSVRKGEPKGHLASKLLKLGRKYSCEECHLGETWNGKKITLHVDHINGINYDHRQENLRFLCPNCHSQTPTFSWKNAGVSSNSKTSDFESLNQGA